MLKAKNNNKVKYLAEMEKRREKKSFDDFNNFITTNDD